MKRSLSSITPDLSAGAHSAKRLKVVKHSIHHQQPHLEQLSHLLQDESVIQKQLIRSIALALSAAGYHEITAAAMESFRSATEDCTSHFS